MKWINDGSYAHIQLFHVCTRVVFDKFDDSIHPKMYKMTYSKRSTVSVALNMFEYRKKC